MKNMEKSFEPEPLLSVASDTPTKEHPLPSLQSIEHPLLEKDTLSEVFVFLLQELKELLNVEVVSLGLLDSEGLMQTLLRFEDKPAELFRNLVFMEDKEALLSIHSHPWKPIYTNFLAKEYTLFQGGEGSEPGSVIMIPLVRRKTIIGTLNLGSAHIQHLEQLLSTDFTERLARVVTVCIEQATYREQVKWLCLTDCLTGIYNRRCFELRLQEELSRAKRRKVPLSCVFLDIDHFKRVNDCFGHGIGDKVLQQAVQLIKGELRQSDFFARYGGDEFILLLPESSASTAHLVTERIRKKVEITVLPFGVLPSITLSAGVASFSPEELMPPELSLELIKKADQALYEAKSAGRNQVRIYRKGG